MGATFDGPASPWPRPWRALCAGGASTLTSDCELRWDKTWAHSLRRAPDICGRRLRDGRSLKLGWLNIGGKPARAAPGGMTWSSPALANREPTDWEVPIVNTVRCPLRKHPEDTTRGPPGKSSTESWTTGALAQAGIMRERSGELCRRNISGQDISAMTCDKKC